MTPPLFVVLSAYNGSRHIAEQIESIRGQTHADWTLVVRDDGSQDDTVAIVEALARADRRIRLWTERPGNLGPVASFGALLEHAWSTGAGYVALCDQDDVWRPDKLERELAVLQAFEREAGADRPALVHSDLEVVDDALRTIHPSFLAHQRLEHVARDPLRRLLVQNFVTGCTVLINRPLLRAAIPVPPVVMHDWWLAQCAAALGALLYLPEPTVRYRQHGANVRGSPGVSRLAREALRRPAAWWREGGRTLADSARQAAALAERLAALEATQPAEPAARALVTRYGAALAPGIGAVRRVGEIRRLGVRPRSLFRPIYYLRLLSM